MIPYDSYLFFLLLLVPLLPSILFGLLGLPARLRATWLLISSLFMVWILYGQSAALVQVAIFLGWEVLLVRTFLTIRQNEKMKAPEKQKQLQRVYVAAVVASILPLVAVKLNPYGLAAGLWHTPIGFLGISYLTFRAVGTVIEIRDGLIKQLNLLDFILYILFFPTLASGPIDRYRRFLADLDKPTRGRDYLGLVAEGIDLIFRGLLYKFIIAYLINSYALAPLNEATGWLATLQYMYVYSFYLFFDFAGYSAFAIGTSLILGIKTPPNFNKPFLSKNIKDFWNRWHMSLSFWFRDYIYMRFVLDSAKKKRFKNRYTSAYLGYFLLFGIMGIWHGTQPQYLAYGLYHAILMISYDWLERKNKAKPFWGKGKLWDALGIVLTAHFVFFGFLIFSGRLL